MKLEKLFALLAALFLLQQPLANHDGDGAVHFQTLSSEPSGVLDLSSGGSFAIRYIQATDRAESINTFAFEVHYDSSVLRYDGHSELASHGSLGNPGTQSPVGDDSNADTDMTVSTSWQVTSGSFCDPNIIPGFGEFERCSSRTGDATYTVYVATFTWIATDRSQTVLNYTVGGITDAFDGGSQQDIGTLGSSGTLLTIQGPPLPAVAGQSVISQGISGNVSVGQPVEIVVALRDTNGDPTSNGEVTVTDITGANVGDFDIGDPTDAGTVIITYTPANTGEAEFSVSVNGAVIVGSAQEVLVVGPPSVLTITGARDIDADTPLVLSVSGVDSGGIAVPVVPLIASSLLPGSGITFDDTSATTPTLTYTPSSIGDEVITIDSAAGASALTGHTISFVVTPGAGDAISLSTNREVLVSAPLSNAVVTAVVVDANGNLLASGEVAVIKNVLDEVATVDPATPTINANGEATFTVTSPAGGPAGGVTLTVALVGDSSVSSAIFIRVVDFGFTDQTAVHILQGITVARGVSQIDAPSFSGCPSAVEARFDDVRDMVMISGTGTVACVLTVAEGANSSNLEVNIYERSQLDYTTNDNNSNIPDFIESLGFIDDGAYADSDNNNIPAYLEVLLGIARGGNDGTTDTDSDGMPDILETYYIRTDAGVAGYYGNSDSDGVNGLRDFVDDVFATIATSFGILSDYDSDGLPDALEVIRGFLPHDEHSPIENGDNVENGDVVTDAVKWYLLDTGNMVPISVMRDIDGDGAFDITEITFGSNPGVNVTNTVSFGGATSVIDRIIAIQTLYDGATETDRDRDGIPDVRDSHLGGLQVIDNPASFTSVNSFVITARVQGTETIPVVSLGPTAATATLGSADITDYLVQTQPDFSTVNIIGVYDYKVSGIPDGATIDVIIPLPGIASSISKYATDTNEALEVRDFSVFGFETAGAGRTGDCPTTVTATSPYSERSGDCLRLTITDNASGLDADDDAGVIVDPVIVSDVDDGNIDAFTSHGSGGCALGNNTDRQGGIDPMLYILIGLSLLALFRKRIASLFLVLGLAFSLNIWADAHNAAISVSGGNYWGIEAGASNLDPDTSGDFDVGDDNDVAFRVFVGRVLDEHWSVEAAYAYLGNAEIDHNDGTSDIEYHVLSAGGLYRFDMTDNIQPFIGLGVRYGEADPDSDIDASVDEDKEIDVYVSVGLSFNASDNYDVRVSYHQYSGDVSMFSVGFVTHF